MVPLQIENAMVVQKNTDRRFDLVKSITKKRLTWGDSLTADKDALAKEIVALADAVLVAMEKQADDNSAVLCIRDRMQEYYDSELRRYEDEPTTDPCVSAYREGVKAASANALGFIKAAMEPETEKPDAH